MFFYNLKETSTDKKLEIWLEEIKLILQTLIFLNFGEINPNVTLILGI